jgi:hypothetical protein
LNINKYKLYNSYKKSKGDQDYPPIDKEELQQRRLHKKNHPLEKIDRVIEEIKKLMLRSKEVVNRGQLNKREPAIAMGKKKKKM